jgi:hypothetical protein
MSRSKPSRSRLLRTALPGASGARELSSRGIALAALTVFVVAAVRDADRSTLRRASTFGSLIESAAAQVLDADGKQDTDSGDENDGSAGTDDLEDASLEEVPTNEDPFFSSADEIRSSLERVLELPEFRPLRERPETEADSDPGWFERAIEWIGDGLRELLEYLFGNSSPRGGAAGSPGGGFGAMLRAVVWIAIAVLILGIVFIIVRHVTGRARANEAPREASGHDSESDTTLLGPPGERPPRYYLDRADQHARRNAHREALAEIRLALASGIERAGWIRHRPGLTGRDYVRAVLKAEKMRTDSCKLLVRNFEQVFFGRRPANADRYHACISAFEEIFPDA